MNPSTRKKISWIGSLGLIVLVLLSVGWIYSRNTLFRFSEIEVISNDPKTEMWVRARLLKHLGQSLFAIPLQQVESELLEARQITKVALRRHWPDKISVELELRRPLALVWNQRQLWLLDREGVLFAPMKEARDLPILRGFSMVKNQNEDWRVDDAYLPALNWLFELSKKDDASLLSYLKIDEVVWEDERGLVLKSFDNELTIELGRQDFDRGWDRVVRAHAYLVAKGHKVSLLDGSYQSRVVGVVQPGVKASDEVLSTPIPALAR